jgi:endonuclease/exonuclease/phosphatase family metal-dependent hydrolase
MNKDFYLFNGHNDYKSLSNRLKSSRLIADRVVEIAPDDVPIIVLGDFNASTSSREIRLIEAIGLSAVPPGGATFRKWGFHFPVAIDHILTSKDFTPQSNIKVWRNRYDGVYPSDHNPVSVKLVFKDHLQASGYGLRSPRERALFAPCGNQS